MPVKSTQEDFIRKATELYGDKYTYDDVVYIRSADKVKLLCLEHGEWEATPANFLNGKGCPKCGRNKLRDLFKHDKPSFIEKANKIHGEGTYDYSLVEYLNNRTSVKIICPAHGVWEQLPSNHYKYGCPTCGAAKRGLEQRTSQEQFIKELTAVHGDKYDYSLVNYTGLSRRIDIICKEHGQFSMFAHVHKGCATSKGADCPRCAKYGYNPALPGILYVLSDGDSVTKIGITNNSLKRRLHNVSKSSGKNFVVSTTFSFDDGSIPDKVETLILKELRATHKQPADKFDGSTECFLNCDHVKLLSRIEQLISQQTAAQTASKEQHSSDLASQEA